MCFFERLNGVSLARAVRHCPFSVRASCRDLKVTATRARAIAAEQTPAVHLRSAGRQRWRAHLRQRIACAGRESICRLTLILTCTAINCAAGVARAQDADPSTTPRTGAFLDLDEAARLAVARQPLLEAQADAVASARQRAVADAQLPDPKLSVGVQDFPVDTATAFSLRKDDFTMTTVGLMQDFPRAEKRRLRGERGQREAELAEQELGALRLSIPRDAALAWLDVWRPERAAALARTTAHEAELQAQAVEIAYRTGRATQADLLAARVDWQLVRDDVADLEQQAAQARNALSRWIGADASRPLRPNLPTWDPPPAVDSLLARLRTHPLLNSAAKQAEVAQAEVQLAKADYKPDWGVELYYAFRFQRSDFVGLKFNMGLPIFTADRQNRGLAAKLHEKDRAEQLREDVWRQQAALARQSLANWLRLQERLTHYDQDILPQSAQRIEAARLAWQSGQGVLIAVLDARRVDLGNRMKRLELEKDKAANRLNVQYLAGDQP